MLNIIVTALVLIINFILQSTALHLIEIRGVIPVSYTHLDVYKRQGWDLNPHELTFTRT